MSGSRLSILAFIAALGAAGLAHAQTAPAPAVAPEKPWGSPGPMAEHMRMHAEARLKAVHDVLEIRPDQEAAFKAFAESMKPEPMGDRPDHPGMMDEHARAGAMTTPERLDMMSKMIDEHMSRMRARFQRHAEAIRALYAVLSPEQKRAFDALPLLMGHGGMGMGMGPHGMWEGHHDGPGMEGPDDRD